MMNIVLNALNSLQYTQRHKDLHNYNYRSMIQIIMQAIAGSMQAITGSCRPCKDGQFLAGHSHQVLRGSLMLTQISNFMS